MDQLIQCDSCNNKFNNSDRMAKLLPKCGHTLCLNCVLDSKNQSSEYELKCPLCGLHQALFLSQYLLQNKNIQDILPTNLKIMKILNQIKDSPMKRQNSDQDSLNQRFSNVTSAFKELSIIESQSSQSINISQKNCHEVFCSKHKDKPIEYFCKSCHTIVCSKCMFSEHNGHSLSQLEEVTAVIKSNIYDLNKLICNTKRINNENKLFIDSIIQEINRLCGEQEQIIDKGFNELIKKLNEKREELKGSFKQKYLYEEDKILQKVQILDQHLEEIVNIENIYTQLRKYVEQNHDAKILNRLNDISQFISRSTESCERIVKTQGISKEDVYIDPSLKPLNLNVQKAFELIEKFSMVHQKKKNLEIENAQILNKQQSEVIIRNNTSSQISYMNAGAFNRQ